MFCMTSRAYRRLFGKTKADLVTQLDGMYGVFEIFRIDLFVF